MASLVLWRKVGVERVTVRLLPGLLISLQPESIALLSLENSPSGSCCSSAVQPAGASASGDEQPAVTLGAAEFAAATNGLGASPFSWAPMPLAKASAASIPPMAWARRIAD